jgi:hypothetical protein
VVITASDGAQTLNGTDGNDRISGDSDTGSTDTLNIGQGGVDTLVFSGVAKDFTVTGFNASGAGADKFDFTSVSASLENANAAVSAVDVQKFNNTGGITGEIVLFTGNVQTSSAEGIQALFNFSLESQPTINSLLTPGVNDMVFFIANDDNTAVNVWRWQDAGADGNVQSTELAMLATLNSLTRQDLDTLQTNQFTL